MALEVKTQVRIAVTAAVRTRFPQALKDVLLNQWPEAVEFSFSTEFLGQLRDTMKFVTEKDLVEANLLFTGDFRLVTKEGVVISDTLVNEVFEPPLIRVFRDDNFQIIFEALKHPDMNILMSNTVKL